ncbi:hypothetical protein CspHIS471_0100550 [Cutaneotrichosporon sp. HIS471]|nr:hypothetical protein CspHIS471_0100550 [Cutaneotrichosporon sp. HIS471]
MPTPPLPVLHALLSSLSLPVRYPSTLAAVPPTLLLLILEHLTPRLSLPPSLRSPRDRNAEIELTKILLGSLAVEVGIDLGAVDPARFVDGSEPDVAALIMALAVVARRQGIQIRLPSEVGEDECDISWESLDVATGGSGVALLVHSQLTAWRSPEEGVRLVHEDNPEVMSILDYMQARGQEEKAKTSRYRQYQKAYDNDSDSCYALAAGEAPVPACHEAAEAVEEHAAEGPTRKRAHPPDAVERTNNTQEPLWLITQFSRRQTHNDFIVSAAQEMLSTSSVPTAVTAVKPAATPSLAALSLSSIRVGRIQVLIEMGDATMETYSASRPGKERRVEVYQTFVDYLVDVEGGPHKMMDVNPEIKAESACDRHPTVYEIEDSDSADQAVVLRGVVYRMCSSRLRGH